MGQQLSLTEQNRGNFLANGKTSSEILVSINTFRQLNGPTAYFQVTMQRWQCPIYNGTLKHFFLIKYELDNRYACFCLFKRFIFFGGFCSNVTCAFLLGRNKYKKSIQLCHLISSNPLFSNSRMSYLQQYLLPCVYQEQDYIARLALKDK